MSNIFDDVFRTICEKMPHLLIPLINEVFGTEYDSAEPIEQLRNEHLEKTGKIITDSLLRIQQQTYHIECQSTDDSDMVIRMMEYDFAIALDSITKGGKSVYYMDFPRSCVVYLRESNASSRDAILNLRFANGMTIPYKMNTICVHDFSKEDIFRKKLLMFIPYYVLRYEKSLSGEDALENEETQQFMCEYKEILERLSKEDSNDWRDLYDLSHRIIEHIAKSENFRKEVTKMGGKVLKLESEIIFDKGKEVGIAEGIASGLAKGRADAIRNMLLAGREPAQIADFCGFDLQEILEVQKTLAP